MSDSMEARMLRDEIEQTRAELGQTVEALAAKADVKARAKQAGRDASELARTQVELAASSVRRSPLAMVLFAGAAAGLIALVVTRFVDRRRDP